MVKWIVGLLVVLLVLGGAGGVVATQTDMLSKLQGGGGREESGTEVQLIAVERGDLTRTVSAPGSIEPRTLVKISAQISAKVLELPFREGERVEAGDVVVRLDPQRLTAQLESTQASLRSEEARRLGAEANLINARLNFERLTTLAETGDVSKAELDAAEAQYLSAQSQREVIEHSIEIAEARIAEVEKDLENTVIASPIAGIITALNAEVGETVIVGTTNNPGSIIMEIADLSEMVLTAQVDETNIAPVREGQPATIYINAFSGVEFGGTVERIGLKRQVAADGTGIFEVEILVDAGEDDRLYSGMTASTDIEVERFYDVLKVPSQCVLDDVRVEDLPRKIRSSDLVDRDKTYARIVMLEADGKVAYTPVEVGPSDLTDTVILAGLEEGDKLVAGPYRVLAAGGSRLSNEARIKDREVAEAEREAEAAAKEAAEEAAQDDAETDGSDGESAGDGEDSDSLASDAEGAEG